MPTIVAPPASASPAQLRKTLADVVSVLNGIQRVGLGPGLLGVRTSGGNAILPLPTQAGSGFQEAPEVDGDPVELTQTQGTQDTDEYDRETDDAPVQFDVITDIQYDSTTHKLTFRTRTIIATGILSVSAESDLVEVTTAVECPCASE